MAILLANKVQDASGLHSYTGTLDGSCSTCYQPDLFYTAACQPGGAQSVLSCGVIPSQTQYYAFTFVELHEVPIKPILHTVEVPLKSCPVLHCCLQFGTFHKVACGVLYPIT